MATIEETLDAAIAHHQAGRLQEAEQLYRVILDTRPDHTDALHLLGLIRHQLGNPDAAIESISRALSLKPGSPVYWENLGTALHGARRFGEAVEALEQAIRLDPSNAKSHFNLGCAFQALGEWDRAAANYQQAIQLQPRYLKAHVNLGAAFRALGRWDEAIACYRQAASIQPDCKEIIDSLNAILRERQAPVRDPRAESCVRIGYAYWSLGQWRLAADSYQRAILAQPTHAKAHNNRAGALKKLGALDEAVASCRRALESEPGYAAAHNTLGALLADLGQTDEALAQFRSAIYFDPDYPDAHMNLGMMLLKQGRFEEGWSHYEWRLKSEADAFKGFPRIAQPMWDGQPLEGRPILLYAEQGRGDMFQFIRYAAMVQKRGGRVLVECAAPFLPLLMYCPGIDALGANRADFPPFDVHAPLLSLPRLFGTDLTSIPAPVPYLFAREELARQWRERLSDCGSFQIGICWQGSPTYETDRQRSFHLTQFAPLAEIPGVQLISLQKGPGTEQLAEAPFPVRILGHEFDESAGAFMDSAAVMKNVDLVITSDTATAHLAGALGVPVWVALPRVADWRWLLDREDSPWYPTMRLFRQHEAGEWGPVFRRMEEALRVQLASRGQCRPQVATARAGASPG
jgi:tetratricopeptide (TPR) repeat protein